ncbi:DUF6585 family protein [Streptomyces mirabilis]|uniref:DUF6585 family protein n=1 Tax=Streptomyces mirabilis TaxID=68239 RepID=UPI00364C7160
MGPRTMAVAAQELELGAFGSLVENNPKRPEWAAIVPLSLLGLGALAFGIGIAAADQRQDGTWYYGLPMLALAALALGLACWFLLRRRPPKTWVAWYEHGVVRQAADQEPEAYGWDEIGHVARQDVKVVKQFGSYMQYRLLVIPEEAGGQIVVDNTYGGVLPFIEGLTDTFSRSRVKQDAARLNAGERVDFGGLIDINTGGLGKGSRRLGWREAERIDLKHGSLHIHRRGDARPWMVVPAVGFPNLLVFLTLCDALQRQNAT